MKVAKLSPKIGKACERLQILSADEETRIYAEYSEKAQRDQENFSLTPRLKTFEKLTYNPGYFTP
ncbi:MAG: hypothetical protein LBS60_02275 [Deltaproteobacteria bacterium]|jgi:hypothetical protein|nr:hypothetical protein [Deltaproteobacteria bacterium]